MTDRARRNQMPRNWYAVSRFGLNEAPRSSDPVDLELVWVHAKEIGTLSTACGLGTLTWHKHWAPFQSVDPDAACPACGRVVADDIATQARRGPSSPPQTDQVRGSRT